MDREGKITKKYIAMIVAAIAAAIIVIIAIGLIVSHNKSKLEGVTRYAWIYNLTENFQIVKHQNESPYYKDVTEDNIYFENIQAAYEWGVLDKEKNFHGDDVATGEFIALTAMKAIGCYKVQIYLGMSELPDDKDYLNLALQKEVISKDALDRGMTQEQALEVLSRAQDLYYSGLWLDDYVNIQYQKDVVELKKEDILEVNNDLTQIQITEAALQKVEKNSSVILPENIAGTCVARKVADIQKDGTVKLEDAQLNDVISSYTVSDIEKISGQDIIEQTQKMTEDGTDFVTGTTMSGNENTCFIPLSDEINIEAGYEGLLVSIVNDKGKLKVVLEDDRTGSSVSFITGTTLGDESIINTIVKISDINVGVQMLHDGLDVNYANVQVESDISITGEVKIESELKIPLFITPVYLGNGTIGVKIPFYLVFSAEGSVKLEAGIPVMVSCEYVKGSGLRSNAKVDCNVSLEADGTAQCALRIEPILNFSLFGLIDANIFDAEADIGIEVSANTIIRINSNIDICMDFSLAAPIVTISFLGDDDADSLLKEIIPENIELNLQFNILDSENTFYKESWHYEVYKDGSRKRVAKCTYNEKGEDIFIAKQPHNYIVKFTSQFTEKEDCYEVKGHVFDSLYIPVKYANGMSVGDTYTYDNITFTLIESGENEYYSGSDSSLKRWLVLKDNNNNLYIATGNTGNGSVVDNSADGEMLYYCPLEYAVAVDNPEGVDSEVEYKIIDGEVVRIETGYKTEDIPGYHAESKGLTLIEVADNYVFQIEKDNIILGIGETSSNYAYDTSGERVKGEETHINESSMISSDLWFSYIPGRENETQYGTQHLLQTFAVIPQPYVNLYIGLDGEVHTLQENSGN